MLTPFGKFARKLRIDHNELLRDMANKLRVTAAYLSAVEVGKRNIPADWVEKIVDLYNLTRDDAEALDQAYTQSVTQLKIDLSSQSPIHKEAAMVFAREFEELDEKEIQYFLDSFRVLKNRGVE